MTSQTGMVRRALGRSTSIREVAACAGVSVGTVSNVLNRPDLVSEGTRRRVLTAIDDLGFVRNESARQLRAGRSRTIGLVVLDVTNPFFTDVARGVGVIASRAGLAVILCSSDDSGDSERRYLGLLEEQRVQALLITPVDVSHERLVQLHRRGMAVVLLDRQSTRPDQCSVSIDDITGGDLAVAHLVRRGHRAITYITGPLATKQCRDRRAGALRALVRTGLTRHALSVVERPAMSVLEGAAAGRRILGSVTLPSAVFCANDLLAIGVMQVLLEQGVSVPKDTAVVGYDDIQFAASAAVPMTSVRQPRLLLGQTAAELALNEAEDEHTGYHKHRHVVFQPELIVRDSS